MKKVFLLIIMICSFFITTTNVKAESIFNATITSIEYSGNNGTTGSFELDGDKVKLLFQKNKDQVVFDVNIKNDGDKTGVLSSVEFIDEANLVTYTTSNFKVGDTLKPGQTKTLKVTAKLKKGLSTDKINTNVKINFKYGDKIIPANIKNPSTRDNILKIIVLFVVGITGLIVLLKFNKKKNIKVMMIILSIMILTAGYDTFAAKSEIDNLDITIEGSIDKNFIMEPDQTNGDTQPVYGNTNVKKNKIEKVYTKAELEIPENAIYSWDVSADQDESVMAYVLDEDNNGMYELYLCEYGGVLANPNSKKMFNYYTKLKSVDFSNLITDDTTTLRSMFQACGSLENINLKNLDTHNITEVYGMFNSCTSLKTADLSGLDLENNTTMKALFNNCTSLEEVNFNGVKTKELTDMSGMFNKCGSLKSVNLSSFNTKKVTDMSYLLAKCKKLQSVNLSSFNTENVTNMMAMFDNCELLSSLDLSNFNTKKVKDMSGMFNNCLRLTTLDISNFDTSSLETDGAMFQFCSSLKNIKMPKVLTRIDDYMFNHMPSYDKETFVIPKTVTFVGTSHIFYNFGTTNFKRFVVEDGSNTLKAEDGILYSKDGKMLYSIPMGKEFENRTYYMPEGLEYAADKSFSRNNNIDKVVLSNTFTLKTVHITSDDTFYSSIVNQIYVFTSVKEYEVKDDNPRYTSYEGCIYNKEGTYLVTVPVHYQGELNIKEGTTNIRDAFWDPALSYYTGITKINIPASVNDIHACQINNLNELGKRIPITIDPDNQTYEMKDGKVVKKSN